MKQVVAQHITRRWERIQTLQGQTVVDIPIYTEPTTYAFQFKRPKRFWIEIKAPEALAGSGVSFDMSLFRGYNRLTNSGFIIENVPINRPFADKLLVKRYLNSQAQGGKMKHAFLGKEMIAGRKTEKYLFQKEGPDAFTQYIWIDRPYMFPLKGIYQDQKLKETYGFEIKEIAYNQVVNGELFHKSIPPDVNVIHFDMANIQKDLMPHYGDWVLPTPLRYMGTTKDKLGSDWMLSVHSRLPNIFYVISSKVGKPELPLEGLVETLQFKDNVIQNFLFPGYGILAFQHQGVHYLVVSNMPHEFLLHEVARLFDESVLAKQ